MCVRVRGSVHLEVSEGPVHVQCGGDRDSAPTIAKQSPTDWGQKTQIETTALQTWRQGVSYSPVTRAGDYVLLTCPYFSVLLSFFCTSYTLFSPLSPLISSSLSSSCLQHPPLPFPHPFLSPFFFSYRRNSVNSWRRCCSSPRTHCRAVRISWSS